MQKRTSNKWTVMRPFAGEMIWKDKDWPSSLSLASSCILPFPSVITRMFTLAETAYVGLATLFFLRSKHWRKKSPRYNLDRVCIFSVQGWLLHEKYTSARVPVHEACKIRAKNLLPIYIPISSVVLYLLPRYMMFIQNFIFCVMTRTSMDKYR